MDEKVKEQQVKSWLYKLMSRLETTEVIDATFSSYEKFGEVFELKIRFGEDKNDKGE